MADIIDLGAALAAAKASDFLYNVLSKAAGGDLSAESRVALLGDLIAAVGRNDGIAWSVAKSSCGEADKPENVLREVLRLAAAETEVRVLCAEGRAILINAVLLALGGGWRVQHA